MLQALENFIPSPQQIEAACAEIQAGWSESERRRRKEGSVCLTKFKTAGVKQAARVHMEHRLAKQREKGS
jgi:hypothetical protein